MCRQGPILRHPGRSATGNRPQCGAQAPSQNDRGQHFRCRPESPTLRIFTRRLLHQLHQDESYPCIENFCARPTASCFFAPRKIVLMMSKCVCASCLLPHSQTNTRTPLPFAGDFRWGSDLRVHVCMSRHSTNMSLISCRDTHSCAVLLRAN